MMRKNFKSPNNIRLNILALSIIAAMTSQSVFAIDNSNQATGLTGNISAQNVDGSIENNDMPVAQFDTIVVVASPSDASEQTEDYVYHTPSTSTGLILTPKQTPQSVTTITSQQIQDQDLETLEDVIMNTPGISEANFDGGKSGSSARGFEIDQYSIDGQKVGYSTGWMTGEDKTSTIIYDRAEVVRGASGLTTGSGRPSASINLVRKRADSRQPTVTLSVDANEHENYGVSFDGSTPITEDGNVRARFAAEYKDGDTYIDRESRERTVLYGVVDADITDNTKIGGGVSYQHSDLGSAMWGALPAYFSDGTKADWDVSKNASVDWVIWHSENLTYFGSLNHDINDDWQVELKGSRSETEGDSKLFYLWANTFPDKQTGLGLNGLNGHYDIERNIDTLQATIDGRFDALGQTHELRFGASYYENEEKAYSYPATPKFEPIGNFFEWDGSYPEPTWGDKTEETNTTITENSLFASGRFQLGERLALILGTRVTDYEHEGNSNGKDIDISHDDVWVPYVGATYDINDNHTLFASYTSIFQPQSEKDINNEYLDPIEGDNYEVGLKSSNDDETLQAQFSVFKIEQDKLAQPENKMIPGVTPPTPAYYEAEGATSTGIDVEVTGEIAPNWKASLGYTQFKAEDANGNTVNTMFPDKLFKLFATYDASNWVSGLTLGAGVNWSGERYNILKNPATGVDEKYDMDDVTLVSLMARYEMSENLDFQLNVDNLFDEKYIESLYFNQIYYGEPLTVSGKLTYKF